MRGVEGHAVMDTPALYESWIQLRILVNALSATSLAGRHVVEGLVSHVAVDAPGRCRCLLVSPGPFLAHLGGLCDDIEVVEGPPATTHWGRRTAWELWHVPRLARAWDADRVVAYSGVRLPGIRVPQVCLACNPRPLVRVPFREPEQAVKHRLQRALYRWSSDGADWTIFNSEHLRRLYLRNGTASACRSLVIPHGLPDAVFDAASSRLGSEQRDRLDILSVSVWSRYKGAETLVEALDILRGRFGVPAQLKLVGPWPEAGYERRIERLVERLGLTDAVDVTGFLPRERLFEAYAEAGVFCLPSYTESFGIPALEAQAFGTPVVGSSTTAMAEVCGDGGEYCEPGRPDTLAEHLAGILTDRGRWRSLAAAARVNAQGYRWDRCVAPLVDLLERHVTESSERDRPAPVAAAAESAGTQTTREGAVSRVHA